MSGSQGRLPLMFLSLCFPVVREYDWRWRRSSFAPPHLLILEKVTTHLDTDNIQALVGVLKSYQGAILVVTHDRTFMRCVVEGESMKALAAASRPEDDANEDSDSSGDENEASGRTRVVYRLSKGKLIKLDRGMEQCEDIAERSATKLGKA